ncbi:DEAD box ATP-dependent RNA helicase, putative [Entamoeba invadens IP1]|uniref:DEAD box ATP-dependent RNA helicase, putative n=1 Tax=Entamoeba invadens IP1 TaxID=370355 RepID=UPI0002C3E2F8|nr:DEAD box ATP-dependent RNA helicase, putative [Entamoeba invadens IP1]ELP93415.1 DEAD box ATP-dependent RNA helicase, putative [Entamoeba invadens IP1]|eukprot:XP_004260186.1 DEAD box ATP-dependent RNA helicase, putative [Entamoeba invadens IP1]
MSEPLPQSFEAITPKLSPETLQTIKDFGFTKPTDVQAQVIPPFLSHKDVIVQSQTGSGKTLSFLIPMFEMIKTAKESYNPREVYGVVISPTRELAQQTHSIALVFGNHFNLKVKLLIGGVENSKVNEDLAEGANIIIGTAGRIEETLSDNLHDLDWKTVEVLILDEGDRMMEMGLAQAMGRIIKFLPKQRRTGVFSATIPDELNKLVIAGCRNPYKILLSTDNITPVSLVNEYVIVPYERRLQTLIHYLKTTKDKKIVVFVLTCDQVEYISAVLHSLPQGEIPEEKRVLSIHGKAKQIYRDKALERFESLESAVLICTDVVARGIDFVDVDCILQYDPPQDPKTYVHRGGRTARMGTIGHSILFLAECEKAFILLMDRRGVKITGTTLVISDEESLRLFTLVREATLKSKKLFVRSQAAFVSYVKGYGEHQCKFIFALKKLSLTDLAHGMCLIKLPFIKEVKKLQLKYADEITTRISELYPKKETAETSPKNPQKRKNPNTGDYDRSKMLKTEDTDSNSGSKDSN